MRARSASLLLALAIALSPAAAHAFLVYDTGAIPKPACDQAQPQKLHWDQSKIDYVVATKVTGGLAVEDLEDVTIRSFDAWATVQCFAAGHTLGYAGRIDSAPVGYVDGPGAKNENAVMFVDAGWGHGPGVLGLTTLTYDTCTGVVVDADIELNSGEFDFSAAEVPPTGRTDMRNTVTHEAGHFLGLDHSANRFATMFAKAPSGETIKRTLDEDDVAGLCYIYASDDQPCPDDVCTPPENGGSASAGSGGGSCAAAGGAGGPLAALMLMFAWRASRRRPAWAPPAPPR